MSNKEELARECVEKVIKEQYNSHLDSDDIMKAFNIGWDAAIENQDKSFKWIKNSVNNKPQLRHSVLMKTTLGIAEGEWQGDYWLQYRWSCRVKDKNVLYWIELNLLDSDLPKEE